jgi:hypothetical protein
MQLQYITAGSRTHRQNLPKFGNRWREESEPPIARICYIAGKKPGFSCNYGCPKPGFSLLVQVVADRKGRGRSPVVRADLVENGGQVLGDGALTDG